MNEQPYWIAEFAGKVENAGFLIRYIPGKDQYQIFEDTGKLIGLAFPDHVSRTFDMVSIPESAQALINYP